MSELALLGGKPALGGRLPPYPGAGLEEMEELLKVLRPGDGNRWSHTGGGTTQAHLERAFAGYCGRRHGIATNTGGMALKIALRAAGLEPGDGVLLQVDTCHAAAFEVLDARGVPVFADVDPETDGLSEESLRATLAEAPGVKILLPVHAWGRPDDPEMLSRVAREHHLTLIEDCSQTLGAEWNGRKVGGAGVAAVFSFGYAKPLQAGEGGIIVTDNAAFARQCRILRARGHLARFTGEDEVSVPGWNGGVSAFVCAVALAGLRRYPELLRRLRANARPVEEAIASCEALALLRPDARLTQSYAKLGFRVLPERLGIPRDLFCRALAAEGVPCQEGTFRPTPRYDFFAGGEWKRWVTAGVEIAAVDRNYARPYPSAGRLHDHEAVYLPRNVLLREADAEAAAAAIRKVCAHVAELRSAFP